MKKVFIILAVSFASFSALQAQGSLSDPAVSNNTPVYAALQDAAVKNSIDKYTSAASAPQSVLSTVVSVNKSQLTITTPNMNRKNAKIEVTDATGTRIIGGKFGDEVGEIDISLLDNGMYNLCIVTPTASFSTRFIK